jgi:hypothetical protein
MSTTATVYAFDVQGHLDAHWAEWLGDLRITHNPDGTSTLIGPIVDQAELHGVLAKLRDLGVALIAVASLNLIKDLSTSRGLRPMSE